MTMRFLKVVNGLLLTGRFNVDIGKESKGDDYEYAPAPSRESPQELPTPERVPEKPLEAPVKS